MEVELFDTGVLKKEEITNEPAISTFVPPNLETRLGTVPAVTYRLQSSSESKKKTDVQDRLGEAPTRRIGPAPRDQRQDQRQRVPAERSDDQTGAL